MTSAGALAYDEDAQARELFTALLARIMEAAR